MCEPRPAPTSGAEVRTRVTGAMLNLDAKFHPETAQHTEENTEAWKLISLCRVSLPSDIKRTAYRERVWDGENVWIRQYMVGYLKVPGRGDLAAGTALVGKIVPLAVAALEKAV
ncbi:hypothetical protein [Micromonospora sp. NPDC050276]|uniref:hypothetical protein n=1 Tax=Micromonospora sp. NPDC050276 TaxID=3364278 RepID=UPI0037BD9E1D